MPKYHVKTSAADQGFIVDADEVTHEAGWVRFWQGAGADRKLIRQEKENVITGIDPALTPKEQAAAQAAKDAKAGRFVLIGRGRRAAVRASAPSLLDAELFALRDAAKYNGTVETEAHFDASHARLVEGHKANFVAEGHDEAEATRMAVIAAGPSPLSHLREIAIPVQAPSPKYATKGRIREAPGGEYEEIVESKALGCIANERGRTR
jgi:hypothetical protein